MVFGRNYDWVTETGVVNTNLRGLVKTSLQLDKGKTFQWTSKYGSITFNQYGKEFPTGGMNEKGLVVELMWLSESQFPNADQRPALSVLQWIQYQLDNCSSIEEVIASDKNVRISAEGAPQHYLVADANGNAATIEFLKGKMVVHRGNSLPYAVLTNSTYQESVQAVKTATAKKDQRSFTDNSLQRFSTACNMMNTYQSTASAKPVVDYSFDILAAVSQGDFTKWSIVYDLSNKKVHFKTASFNDVKTFSFAQFDLACTAKAVSFDMQQAAKGEVSKKFINYSPETNTMKLKAAFAESRSQIKVTEEDQEAMAALARAVKCKQ